MSRPPLARERLDDLATRYRGRRAILEGFEARDISIGEADELLARLDADGPWRAIAVICLVILFALATAALGDAAAATWERRR